MIFHVFLHWELNYFRSLQIDWPKNDNKNFPVKIHFSISSSKIFFLFAKKARSYKILFTPFLMPARNTFTIHFMLIMSFCQKVGIINTCCQSDEEKSHFFTTHEFEIMRKDQDYGEKWHMKMFYCAKAPKWQYIEGGELRVREREKSIKSLWIIQWKFHFSPHIQETPHHFRLRLKGKAEDGKYVKIA